MTRILTLLLLSASITLAEPSRDYSIPMLDLPKEDSLFTTVERRDGYLGHPSTVLFRDGKSLLVAYPDGHGRGELLIRRSTDAGQTWKPVEIESQRVEETPVLYRLDLPGGGERVLLVTCRPGAGILEWMWSDDRGNTWSDPHELPGSLTGHRHESANLPDGRTIVFMRDYSPLNPTNPSHGDWVAWVGTFADLEQGREGQYRIRLRRNYGNSTNNNVGDCGYTGVELLPDGQVLAITYGHWDLLPGSKHPNHPDGRGKSPYILQVKLDLRLTDQWVKDSKKLVEMP